MVNKRDFLFLQDTIDVEFMSLKRDVGERYILFIVSHAFSSMLEHKAATMISDIVYKKDPNLSKYTSFVALSPMKWSERLRRLGDISEPSLLRDKAIALYALSSLSEDEDGPISTTYLSRVMFLIDRDYFIDYGLNLLKGEFIKSDKNKILLPSIQDTVEAYNSGSVSIRDELMNYNDALTDNLKNVIEEGLLSYKMFSSYGLKENFGV